jgi:hypothetical protein
MRRGPDGTAHALCEGIPETREPKHLHQTVSLLDLCLKGDITELKINLPFALDRRTVSISNAVDYINNLEKILRVQGVVASAHKMFRN